MKERNRNVAAVSFIACGAFCSQAGRDLGEQSWPWWLLSSLFAVGFAVLGYRYLDKIK